VDDQQLSAVHVQLPPKAVAQVFHDVPGIASFLMEQGELDNQMDRA
jgi:hypothetical protein